MTDNKTDKITRITKIISCIDGIQDFFNSYHNEGGLETFYNDLYEYKSKLSDLTSQDEKNFEDLREAINSYLECFSTNSLYYINEDKILDEEELDEFRNDWEKAKTEKETFKVASIHRYKTITEYFKYELHDSDLILSKYNDPIHPLINAIIGESLMNGGYYEQALSYLANGLNYSLRFPHLYWHNKFGMIGCTKVLWNVLWLIIHRNRYHASSKKYDYWRKVEYQINEMLYLSITRAIDMAPELAQTCDLLSNRAELFWVSDYGQVSTPRLNIGMAIFADAGFIPATMEVQYIADKKLAFVRACKIHSSLAGVFHDKLNESLMMYRYSNLRPNLGDVNPMSINDDVSYDQMVDFGIRRADAVASHIYTKFSNHKLNFTRQQIEELILNLREVYHNISPSSEFYEIYNSLKDVAKKYESSRGIPVLELKKCMHILSSKCQKYDCYEQISQYINNLEYSYVSKYVLEEIMQKYKTIERNYNWEETITKPIDQTSEESTCCEFDEVDPSISYDDQGNKF